MYFFPIKFTRIPLLCYISFCLTACVLRISFHVHRNEALQKVGITDSLLLLCSTQILGLSNMCHGAGETIMSSSLH